MLRIVLLHLRKHSCYAQFNKSEINISPFLCSYISVDPPSVSVTGYAQSFSPHGFPLNSVYTVEKCDFVNLTLTFENMA